MFTRRFRCTLSVAAVLALGGLPCLAQAGLDIGQAVAAYPWWIAPGAALLLLGIVAVLVDRNRTLRQRVARHVDDIARSAAEWSQAMDFLEDPMYLVDLDDRLIRANRAFYRQINKEPDDVLGCDIRGLIHLKPEKKPCPACAARLARRDDFFTKEADDPTNPTGRPIEVTVRVIRDQHGQPLSILQALRDLSHLRHTEDALRNSQTRLADAQRIAHVGSWEWDIRTDALTCSAEAARLFELNDANTAYTLHDLAQKIHPEQRAGFLAALQHTATSGADFSADYRIALRDAPPRIIHQQAEVAAATHGKPTVVVGTAQDITARKLAEGALVQEREKAQVTLQSIGDAVITTDVDGRIEYINPTAERLLGRSLEQARGRRYGDIVFLFDNHNGAPIVDLLARSLSSNPQAVHAEHQLIRCLGGIERAVDLTAAPIVTPNGVLHGGVLVLHDVTEMHGMARQLDYQATHDALTGLINRREFDVRLQQTLDAARVDDTEHALIFMDLDNFKVVNDTCGHLAGDELLKQITGVCLTQLRKTDLLARLGGDEFAVLLEGCGVQPAERIAEQLRNAIAGYRFNWEGQGFSIGVSMGIIILDKDSGSCTEVLRQVDSACYLAKESGRNRYHLSTKDDAGLAHRNSEMLWAQHITDALQDNRFELFCQTIQALQGTSEARHYEVLLRLRDTQGKLVPPFQFMPAAERYQLMPAIDRWVVHEALRRFAEAHARTCYCAINLSGQSITDRKFLEFVIAQIETSGIDPQHVCFEITETAAVANLAAAQHFINTLRARGVRFALDDFGSGMSSFGYLRNLKVDFLKIDGSFVKDMVEDAVDYAMVSSINQIGQIMGIQTVAEFVENDLIRQKLKDLRVDFGQGYGIHRPQPLDEVLLGASQPVARHAG